MSVIYFRAIFAGLTAAVCVGLIEYVWMKHVSAERRQKLKVQHFLLVWGGIIIAGLSGREIGSMIWTTFYK